MIAGCSQENLQCCSFAPLRQQVTAILEQQRIDRQAAAMDQLTKTEYPPAVQLTEEPVFLKNQTGIENQQSGSFAGERLPARFHSRD